MPKIKLEIGVLNVAMHNHDEGELSYKNLFKAIHNNDSLEIQLDETHAACIGELNTNKKFGSESYFIGQIYKYAKIDPERECLNTKTKKVATDEEKKALIVPKHLRPHFVKIPFVFIPKGHRLYIQTKHKGDSFGITKAKKLLELLVQNVEIFRKFRDVEITIEPDSVAVENLINRKDIDKLVLDIVRPNPDDLKSVEKSFFEQMKKRNLKKQRVEYTSTKDENLVLDKEMKDEVKIAASNGKVIADRTDENRGEDPAEKHLVETAFDNHSEIIG